MKKCTCLLVFGMLLTFAQAQYVVTKVTGLVRLKPSGTLVVPGMKLAGLDQLDFSGPADNIRIMAAGKGIYSLSRNPNPENRLNAVADLIKSTLNIKAREGTLSGRGAADEKIPEVFETEPTVNSKICISPESRFVFDLRKYPVNEGGRFFLQVESPGAAPGVKSLRSRGDTLFMSPSDFSPAGNGTSYTLGFFDKNSGESRSITPLFPYLDTAGETRAIIAAIRSALPRAGEDSVKNTAYREVYTALGKPSLITFNLFFNIVKTD